MLHQRTCGSLKICVQLDNGDHDTARVDLGYKLCLERSHGLANIVLVLPLKITKKWDNLWKSRGGIVVNGAPREVPESTQWTP